jgi:hypothetical protein
MSRAELRQTSSTLLFPDTEDAVRLELEVRDPDTVAELLNHPIGEQRDEFALAALRIGVLALRQARGRLDGDLIQRETERMLSALDGQLRLHATQVQKDVSEALREYFAPDSGRFQERVERLIRKDGELEEVLRRQVGAQDSELCKTLAAHFGQQSPIVKLLSPEESNGVLAALRNTLDEQLKGQRDHVLREFSLDNKDGALARLVNELSERHGKLTEEIDDRIDELVKEFSADEADSAFNRLLANVDRAQRTITDQFSLDNEASALSRLKAMLTETNRAIQSHLTLDDEGSALSRLKRELFGLLETQQKQSQVFQEEVKVTLSQIAVRRAEAARTTSHGREFEEAVVEFITREAQRAGDIATRTGATPGLIKSCKTGDCVVELGPESAVPGAKLVIEAKDDKSYQLVKARSEIEEARKNRGSEVGLFIFARHSAPAELETLQRLGNDVFVVWDAEDAHTDVYLKAALTLAKALCVRAGRQREAQAADFEALDRAILDIEKHSEKLGDIENSAEKIIKAGQDILDRIRISRKALFKQIDVLRDTTGDLKQAMQPTADAS